MQQCYMPGGRRNNNSPATGDFVGRTGPDLYGLERRRTGPEFVLHNIQRWVLGTAAQLPQHRIECSPGPLGLLLTLKIHDFRNTEGLAMVQIRYRGGFETKSEAFT